MNRRDFIKGFVAATAIALVPLPVMTEVHINTVTFDSLVATTLKQYAPILTENITRQNVVFNLFKERGLIRENA